MNIKKKDISRPFLERVATFDLDRYYTPGVRFLCHLSMWLVFTSLLQLNLFLDSDVILDVVLQREGFYEDTFPLFKMREEQLFYYAHHLL